ncbi:MAG: hypothetical protein J6C37_12435 [Roseburia sp.]|nr:hypothetical protein [Roseburia sp.]
MKIIPHTSAPSGSYWCSWRTQRLSVAETIARTKLIDSSFDGYYARTLRETLSDQWLFDSPGVLSKYMERIRGDLLVMLDDGWDIPYERDGRCSYSSFGSFEPNPSRFPYGGTPAERLTILSDKVKALGYAGLGLWIPMQAAIETKDNLLSLEEFTAYWEERARWCRQADIRYIKVDWGFHNWGSPGENAQEHCIAFRTAITDVFHAYAPQAKVEHAMMQYTFHVPLDAAGEDFVRRLAALSDAYRLYDITPSFNTVTTLNRAAEILSLHQTGGGGCLINSGEEPYIAATLGMTMGMMSHPFISGTSLAVRPVEMSNGILPVQLLRSDFYDYTWYERALFWQRLCPPVPLGDCPVTISDERFTDSWTLTREPYPYYPQKMLDSTQTQTAPAAIARNTPLPRAVSDGPLPYLTALRHPSAGAYAVGMLARTIDGVMNCTAPSAAVTAYPGCPDQVIGIFGPCRQIDLVFDQPVSQRRVYLGGMLDEEAADLTQQVVFPSPNVLRIPGELLNKIGSSGQAEDDYSDPASVVKLV